MTVASRMMYDQEGIVQQLIAVLITLILAFAFAHWMLDTLHPVPRKSLVVEDG